MSIFIFIYNNFQPKHLNLKRHLEKLETMKINVLIGDFLFYLGHVLRIWDHKHPWWWLLVN